MSTKPTRITAAPVKKKQGVRIAHVFASVTIEWNTSDVGFHYQPFPACVHIQPSTAVCRHDPQFARCVFGFEQAHLLAPQNLTSVERLRVSI
jgi:hypothetical protein